MSVCAVMLVRDEADVLGYTLEHLFSQVDAVIVADNRSSDGSREIARAAGATILDDPAVGYFQSRKTTRLAQRARKAGHAWVLPCDADEVFYAPDGRTLSQYLGGMPPDVQIVKADLYNHWPTAEDPDAAEQPNPLLRLGWRQREHAPLPKVAARTAGDLVIEPGNHGASYRTKALDSPGLVVRHFSWRSPEQYLRKIRNGVEAYAAATGIPESLGVHWRMWQGQDDDAILAHYARWFYKSAPREDEGLIYDPAPIGRRTE